MKSFLGELKRRNVVRVAVLYAVVGWLVVQIAATTVPLLGIPAWGGSLALLLVVLGFPIALVLAWAYELTPDGIKRTHEVDRHESIAPMTGRRIDFLIIGVLAAALLFVGYQAYWPRLKSTSTADSAAPALPMMSIAVLPFDDMSQAQDQEYLADGIAEELLNVLGRAEGFKVTGRTSSFAFKGHDEDLRVIGQKLGVEHILEGSVRKQGDRIRITAQLVKASDGYHLWSETYDRQLDDVFAVQDDIARQVVTAIRDKLGSPQAARAAIAVEAPPTDNVEAYAHFLRGQQLVRLRTRTGLEAAVRAFEQAVELDPEFARARVGIANSLLLLTAQGARGVAEIEGRAQAELDRAAALSPDLADIYAARALLLRARNAPIPEQIPLLERAVAVNPRDTQSILWLGQAYRDAARFDDELREYERAYAIDPLFPMLLQNLAGTNHLRGERKRAERYLNELADLQPVSAMLYSTRAVLAIRDQRFDNAIRWVSALHAGDPDNGLALGNLAEAYGWLGDTQTGLRHAARLKQLTPEDSWGAGLEILLHLWSGDRAKAQEMFEPAAARYAAEVNFFYIRAYYLSAQGDHGGALQSLLKISPEYNEQPPVMWLGSLFNQAPLAVFLFRKNGNELQARRIEASFNKALDGCCKSPDGRHVAQALTARAQMAAVTGDRAQLIAWLNQLYDAGGAIAAYEPEEPWFRPYRGDKEIEALFAKFDARRADWRRQLAAEGL